MEVAIPLVNVATLEHVIPCLIIAEDQARVACEKYIKEAFNLKNGNCISPELFSLLLK
jgi:ABC-type amino acid transport system permease subunit